MKISDPMPSVPRALIATSPALDLFGRDRGLHPQLSPSATSAADAGSLASQRTDRRFAVVIVENDAAGCDSVPVAAEFLKAGRFPGLCVVEPRQGNCHAINAAFETALATFPAAAHFLMIDDDEIASADWLELMVRSARGHRRRPGRRAGAAAFRRRQQARASPPSGISPRL